LDWFIDNFTEAVIHQQIAILLSLQLDYDNRPVTEVLNCLQRLKKGNKILGNPVYLRVRVKAGCGIADMLHDGVPNGNQTQLMTVHVVEMKRINFLIVL
jgi:hypothetical protein